MRKLYLITLFTAIYSVGFSQSSESINSVYSKQDVNESLLNPRTNNQNQALREGEIL